MHEILGAIERIDDPGRHARRDLRHAAGRRRGLLADDRVVRKLATQCLGDEPFVGLVGLGHGSMPPAPSFQTAPRACHAADRSAALSAARRSAPSTYGESARTAATQRSGRGACGRRGRRRRRRRRRRRVQRAHAAAAEVAELCGVKCTDCEPRVGRCAPAITSPRPPHPGQCRTRAATRAAAAASTWATSTTRSPRRSSRRSSTSSARSQTPRTSRVRVHRLRRHARRAGRDLEDVGRRNVGAPRQVEFARDKGSDAGRG